MSSIRTIATQDVAREAKPARNWRLDDPQASGEIYNVVRRNEAGVNRISPISAEEHMARLMRISEIRSEISKGDYDSDRRLDIALDRMIDSI